MGRLIDVDAVKKRFPIMENDFGMVINDRLHKELDKIPTVEAIPKDQYEARFNADMVAMLEEIDLQFDEICFYKNMGEWKTVPEIKAEYKAIIREKINSLKEDQEGEE